MRREVKICGLRDAANLDAAIAAGADLVGFVFFPPSPRAVTPEEAGVLARRAAGGPIRTGLFVDPDDALLEGVLAAAPLDLIQLHGEESPERAADIRARFARPVMKALPIGEAADLEAIGRYAPVVDRFLFDARPPPGAALPGGNALPFDWRLLAGVAVPKPWLLAGGLDADNVAEALRLTRAPGADVSSGVERARGVKDPALIRAFIAAVRGVTTEG